ncbi:isoleucine--tRNA ligase [Telmatobacter sp. DSM 110680]|uniref:Isoleucine--tRNA ligase n=1 Tax=Telmatobacter sp. DSM 110680 TaxID=3036704 RepID=A0AAU7DEJ5_9BACT
MSPTPELKATLTLPQTTFPMKANLPQNEPLRLKKWAELRLYEKLRESCAGRPPYLLHDGPPYANGPIHLGHALNKGLKDFVVKSKTMAGFDSPYVPGYDCHGLPIEIKVDEQLGRKKLEMPVPEVLAACRAYAQKYVDLQTSQFERIGCFGRWEKPYMTMARDYEARTLEAFYGFLEKGFVYRGLKPVYWCIHDRTALAEAEVEYDAHTSPSIYVRYKLTSAPEKLDPALAGRQVYTIIWTTTPWTIPASMAVAFHPDFEYVAFSASGDPKLPGSLADPVYIVAAELAPAVIAACKLGTTAELARFKGDQLEHTTFKHPFLDRSILGVLATYVTADQGTGAVHTAPSHGADDFYTGQRYDLDQTCRVDASGHLHVDPDAWPHASLPAFEGKRVWAANPIVVAMLEEYRALLAVSDLEHSYPHCWRCHHPVIFRATEQWFISLETPMKRADGSETTYRQLSIEEIDKVVWDPSWGKERITNMIATRPDWCISRQRIWGVPIAVFMCEGCDKPIIDPALDRKIITLFERDGADAWHTTPIADLLPAGTKCSHCEGVTFRKETDILDVWFDSGTSWFAVCESDADLKDIYKNFQESKGAECLYLEGGDQHRGWFHSSLLTSVALRGRAPYSHVATAGWTLDEQGRAMSKSLGNGVDPVDIAERMGGEIVRLWVASIDFREDMAASENLMARCAELYRKLRNTFRFLLGNLNGFDPMRDRIAEADLLPLDQYMLARTRELTEKILGWYADFEFHRVYQAVNDFAIVDLSSFYLDILKDRMYTFAPTSHERRSAQTVLWQITEALVRLVAPIVSFTADEVWEYLPIIENREASVHLALFPKPEEIFSENSLYLLGEWKVLFALRESVLRSLEELRQNKVIGKATEAEVKLYAQEVSLEILRKNLVSLKEFLNVSKVTLVNDFKLTRAESNETKDAKEVLTGIADLQAFVLPASGHKCARCWNFMPVVSDYGIWQNVCTRCHNALKEMGIAPPEVAA